MNLTLISAAIAAACGFAVAWNIQAKILSDTKLEHADATIQQQRAARASVERATGQVIAAQNAASVRNTVIRRDADRSASSGNGLRLASTSAVRTASSDSAACNATVAAYSVILDESISFIREVSGVADQCISDNQALTDAGPK